MTLRNHIVLGILFGCSVAAQTKGTPSQYKGTGVPSAALCVANSIGQHYFRTDATPGQNIYLCTSAGAWTLLAGATAPPAYQPNSLLSGGGVEWVSGLSFTVGAAEYIIGGVSYTSALTNLTLGAADPTDPRIDMITLTSSGTAVVVAGTPAPSPAEPVVDPDTQLPLAFIYVAAGATTPTNIASSSIYRENVEWTTSQVGGTFSLASTNFPYEGTVDIEGTSVTTGNYVQFVAPAPIDLAEANNLTFYIRSKAAWPSTRFLQFTWFNGSTQLGTTIQFGSGQFGFQSATTGAYQQVQIPLSLFNLNGIAVDRLRVTCVGSGAVIGMYMDAFSLQSGIVIVPNSVAMIWKGAWNATVAYKVNDVVSLTNRSYVAIVNNTNSSPPSANWSVVGYGNVTAASTLTSTAVVTGAGTTAVQTPSATATLDSSGNYSTPGQISLGVGGGVAGAAEFGQGTAPTAGTTSVTLYGHSAITSYIMRLPSAAATGFYLGTNTAGTVVMSQVAASGNGSAVVTTTGTQTSGRCVEIDSNGNHIQSAAPCGSGSVALIANGTSALGTSAISSEACATVVTTTATGVASTDAITWVPNASIKAVTGYVPLTAGGLTIAAYPTTNNVNFDVCNWTSSSITPGAVTINWRVVR